MITFAEHMERVLYGPDGYYASGTAKSGKAGDYFTAPDIGPVFGKLLAEIFKGWKQKLKSGSFSVMEVGAGEGRLANDILATEPFPYITVERSPQRMTALKQLPSVDVYSDLASAPPMEGVLFGNELIDAFPVHRVRMKNEKLEEAYVSLNSEIRIQNSKRLEWGPPSTPLLQSYFDRLGITLPDDYETEVNLAMADWLKEAAQVLQKGLVVLIDYGRPAHDYYAPERTRGTLRCFSGHRVFDPFLSSSPAATGGGSIGPRQSHSGATSLDWTSDVDFTSLALDARVAGFIPLAFMELGTFLMAGVELFIQKAPLNISSPLVGEDVGGGDKQHAVAPHPAPSPTRGEGINRGLRYLLHPEGLGTAFHVLILGKGVDPGEWTFEHNRLRRLGLPE